MNKIFFVSCLLIILTGCVQDSPNIKQIENLVNEFSDFARMPKPLIKNNDLIKVLDENINLLID